MNKLYSLRYYVFCIFILCYLACGIASADECSLVKTNQSCTYTVNRSLPLTPPTIQMYSGQTVTIAIANGYTFESYSVDWTSGVVNTPTDVGTAAFTALQPSIKNLNEWETKSRIGAALVMRLREQPTTNNNYQTTKTYTCNVIEFDAVKDATQQEKDNTYLQVIAACTKDLESLQADTSSVYSQLQALIWPHTIPLPDTGIGFPLANGRTDFTWEKALACEIAGDSLFYDSKGNPLKIKGDALQCPDTLPVSSNLSTRLAKESVSIGAIVAAFGSGGSAHSNNADVLAALQLLQDIKAPLDTARTDLLGYGSRVTGLIASQRQIPGVIGSIPVVNSSKTVIPQVVYNVNAINLIAVSQSTTDNTKKQLIVPITIVYGDERWEVSAGTFFSSLPIRSFSPSAAFTKDVVTDHIVTQDKIRPLVVPFGALNYRLTDDLKCLTWRTNLYWTGAIGINPNTVTTDFATGPSLSYRGLMFSGLWHIGHDTKLTQGLNVGDSLGANFGGSSVPTKNYWRFDSFAIGVSIRTPSITNR